jgi:membrane protease YdiL (CAAX protease family)
LFLGYFVAQFVFSLLAGAIVFGSLTDERELVKATIIATLPAALATAGMAWLLAGAGRADPRQVLALRWPRMTPFGWVTILAAFLFGMYLFIVGVTFAFGIDLAEYTPGPDGSSPESGSSGLVKEAMFSLAQNPLHFTLAFLSVSIGAPLAEELVFRRQLFASLAHSWLGRSGAVLVTTALWSLMHLTEPWLNVGMIFVMGLVLGWLLLRFGSLYLTMARHGAWNGVYSLVIFGSQGS